jgi:hypothetical protein
MIIDDDGALIVPQMWFTKKFSTIYQNELFLMSCCIFFEPTKRTYEHSMRIMQFFDFMLIYAISIF